MEEFIKGDVVVIPFPFSDLSQTKRRPAMVISSVNSDIILCQITSKNIKDEYSIYIDNDNFVSGNLNQQSNIRPNRIFTADKNLIIYKIDHLNQKAISTVIDKIIDIIRQ